MLCRLSDLRDKEVVNINNGSCMGCVSDVDTEDTKVTLLQAPAGMAEAFVFGVHFHYRITQTSPRNPIDISIKIQYNIRKIFMRILLPGRGRRLHRLLRRKRRCFAHNSNPPSYSCGKAAEALSRSTTPPGASD